ncbi:MAG TPA: hypothetical protein PKV72_05800, partial [Candidatus Peribacteria bacterium]|nr:hypothetical protein [Candidatus Peribacteria bacterium]
RSTLLKPGARPPPVCIPIRFFEVEGEGVFMALYCMLDGMRATPFDHPICFRAIHGSKVAA